MKLTHHCAVERANRVKEIISHIGLGQIVKEKYIHTQAEISAGQAGHYFCITDTGITLLKDEDKETIITMYVTTFRELVMIYNGVKHIPSYLRKKVDRNQSFYIKNGKTIWD